ncbi:MAG: hypothetical protein QME78_00175 [Thermodesulfobacteriota bacterium]|nr:hypothetical protein [Thermodesulfobacteriota bacterium]
MWMLTWFLGPVGRYVGIALLLAALYGGCQVKSCISHQAEVKAKTAEKTLEVEREDQKVKEQVRQMSDDDLADFIRRGGVRQKH